MKSTAYLSFLAICLMMLSICDLHAQPEAIVGKLPVFGSVTTEGKKSKNAIVTVFSGNDVWQEIETNKRGEFQVTLDFNQHYTFEFKNEGLLTKRLAINTHVENEKAKPIPFECYIDLVPTTTFDATDISNLDFPIAIVNYNKKRKQFEPVMEYSMNMVKEYDRLKATATTE